MRSHTILTKFITSCFRDCTISITNILIYYFFNMRHPISRCHNNISKGVPIYPQQRLA